MNQRHPHEIEQPPLQPGNQYLAQAAPPTIHYTQLQAAPTGSPLATEWNFYRQSVGRLLADGHEGKWLLITQEQIVGIWDTEAQAQKVRLERFLMKPVLLKQILAHEPILRIGYNRLCPS
jgi:hypothetical protein